MKKVFCWFMMIISLIIFSVVIITYAKPSLHLNIDFDGTFSLVYNSSSKNETIYPWFQEEMGVYYFFLPSFAQGCPVHFSKSSDTFMSINNVPITASYSLNWQENGFYHIITENINATISFTCSENIPSMFITTDNNSAPLFEDKNYSDSGQICTYTANGLLQYHGALEKITTRGNTTWNKPKKPFSIKLEEDAALCGLEQGKKWVCHALYYEGSNMVTKLAFDLANEIGLPYSSQSTWIDLYINGEYQGLYLLSEAMSIADTRIDIYDLEKENLLQNKGIDSFETFAHQTAKGYLLPNVETLSGGYLIEKEFSDRFADETAGFITDSGYSFNINAPKHASLEQVYYIKDYIQKIENLIHAGDTAYYDYIDLTSFAHKFVLEEFFNNYDAYAASTFFYKDKASDKLYCSPPWDYDSSIGRNGYTINYENSLIDSLSEHSNSAEILDWWHHLYTEETFHQHIVASYESLLPTLIAYGNHYIDTYAEYIRKASEMDLQRWNYANQYYYSTYDNNIKHLKYYWNKRIEFLCKKWSISCPPLETPTTANSTHSVTFAILSEKGLEIIETRTVPDGQCLANIPSPPKDHVPWFLGKTYMTLSDKLPIYEDITVYTQYSP